jgi:hypothetical protein
VPRGKGRTGNPLGKCVICVTLPLKDMVNARFAEGASVSGVSREVHDAGYHVSYMSVRVHREHTNTPQMSQSLAKQDGAKPRDLAIVVRDRTLEAVENGELNVTDSNWKNVTPGLQAQNLLDKREARVDDKKTAELLARLLYGAPGVQVLPPERLLIADGSDIEGEFTVVEP